MKNCGVKTKDILPRLMISKLDGKEVSQETRDYTSLFGDDSNEPSSKRRRTQQRKILLKGPLGSGKTRVARKVQRNWVKDCFATFSVVFFILVKLINPGEAIENVIVKQYGLVKEDKKKILDLLQNHKRKCCIIFDGVNTINEFKGCVLHFIQDHRLSECDILVTSDIFETGGIDYHFGTVCETQVLTVDDAKTLVSDIVKDEDKVTKVMNFKMAGPSIGHLSGKYNPIVLSLLAGLVQNNEIDGNGREITLGNLYSKLVKFVCKKCSGDYLIDILTMTGKLSLDVLQGKRVLRETDDDVKTLDSVVFDSGILVRHNNSFVTSCHRSLGIFFAAVYFVLLLKEGFEIGTDPLLLTDHLLLYFCLSLLENPLYLNISNTVRARGNFEAFMRLKLDNSQFDLKDFIQNYPAFSVIWGGQNGDDLVKDFTFKMLSCCKSIENLVLCSSFPFTELLSQMNPGLSTLQKIQIGDLIVPADVDVPLVTRENEINIFVNDLSDSSIEKLLKIFRQTGKRLCIYVICSKGTFFDLTILFQPKVKRIHIHQIGEDEIDLLVDREIPECPVEFLHLSSPSVKVGKDVFSALSKAVKEGKLAHLSHLYLVKLYQASGMLPHLFECEWPNLTHLDMSDIQLDVCDVRCLREYIFSKLTSLSVLDP